MSALSSQYAVFVANWLASFWLSITTMGLRSLGILPKGMLELSIISSNSAGDQFWYNVAYIMCKVTEVKKQFH